MTERAFPSDPESVAAARGFAASELESVDADLVDRVLLLVSELASNSVRHAHASFRLRVDRDDEEIHVSVRDEGGGRPQVRHPSPSEPSGRGLQIVAALSDRWGIDADGSEGGPTTVWFVIRTGRIPARDGRGSAVERRPSSAGSGDGTVSRP